MYTNVNNFLEVYMCYILKFTGIDEKTDDNECKKSILT